MTTATPPRSTVPIVGFHPQTTSTSPRKGQPSSESVRDTPNWSGTQDRASRTTKAAKHSEKVDQTALDPSRNQQQAQPNLKVISKSAVQAVDAVSELVPAVAAQLSKPAPVLQEAAKKFSGGTGPQQDYTQARRPMAVTTPLGKDQLLLIGMTGEEGLSKLFHFHLDLLALNGTPIPFENLLGQDISIRLNTADGKERFINGICSRVAQAGRDATFTSYRMEVVPKLWMLTRNLQSRIFQQISVPDILKKVLAELDVAFDIRGQFEPRDYCVQYRESDFDFASRLMEEEGIYYYFRHTANGHKLVLANTPQNHSDLPVASQLIFETISGGFRPEDRVYGWEKVQELRSGTVSLWDHCFELPHRHLEATRDIQDAVKVGKTLHPLKLPTNRKLEQYSYPGEYAQRFDGVNPSGTKRSADLQKIFQDNQRTARVRMEQEAVLSLAIEGESNCRQLVSGHRFTLTRHFDADGQYVLTTVKHRARLDDYRSDSTGAFKYSNQFTCIPIDLPYRPQRLTEKPTIHGTQTAVVVGPPGEEIWPDQYGRVKVQFHWDREGKNDLGSSCWVRVSTPWAGKQWGMIHIPRIGQEVIVAFEEGDPDRPIIVGSVYNFEQMPPFPLPANKTQSGIKSRTHKGQGYNEIVFDDTAGKEQIRMHGQHNMDTVVKNNQTQVIGMNRKADVGVDETMLVGNNQALTVGVNKSVKVGTNHDETVGANQTVKVGANQVTTVGANQKTSVAANQSISVGSTKTENVGMMSNETVGLMKTTNVGVAYSIVAGAAMNTAVGFISAEEVGMTKKIIVGSKLEITVGASKLVMEAGGKVTIEGTEFLFSASGNVKINGAVIDLN